MELPASQPLLSPRARAYVCLLVGLVSIGFSAIFVRLAGAPGTVSAFYRMAIASLVIAPIFLYRQYTRSRERQAGARLAILAGALFAGDLAFWSTGIDLSGATIPTLMANSAPIWVALAAWLLFGERLGRRFWLGLAVALFGAALVLGLDLGRGAELGRGSLFGLLAAFFYAAYYLVTERGRASLDTLTFFWLATASSAAVLLALNLLLSRPLFGYDAATYRNFLGLGLLSQTLGWLSINYAQGLLPASVVAPTMLGQPVFTAVAAVVLLGEILLTGHLLGGAAVLLGVLIVHRSRAASANLDSQAQAS